MVKYPDRVTEVVGEYMEIKEFHADLLEPLRKLYFESRSSTFTWLDARQFELSDFERDTEGERLWVAMESDRVVGFLSIQEPDNFIHHLYIDPNSLRGGIGSTLLDMCKLNYSELSLKCLIKNQKALHFYESQGFVKCASGGHGDESYYSMKFSSHI